MPTNKSHQTSFSPRIHSYEIFLREQGMSMLQRWQNGSAALIAAGLMAACGGGGGGGNSSAVVTPAITVAPAVATDGLNWINTRRTQLGVPALTRNALVDQAAQNHSAYQGTNPPVSHDETIGKSGYTGATVLQRLNHVGYTFTGGYAYGEVISGSASTSGEYLAEELVTAIYHRFVIFEPKFKEIGAGAVTDRSGYTYFTTNFTANNGLGAGIGATQIVTWPVDGQTGITRNFLSDSEKPDPVDGQNEVGYPVSVHADLDVKLTVTSFTMRPRGGADISVKLLAKSRGDIHAPDSAVSIVPLAVLAPNTTYDVSFAGTSNDLPISKIWSFTTKP